jgi:hypothetical protein
VTEVPGATRHEQTITVARGDHSALTVTVPARSAASGAPESRIAGTASGPQPSRPRPAPVASRAGWAYVAGGAGIVGLAVGGITGGIALGSKGTIEEHCIDHVCDAEGKAAADRAQTMGWASTVGFGVGLVGVGIGAVLLLLEPTATTTSRTVPARVRPVAGGGTKDGFVGIEGAF